MRRAAALILLAAGLQANPDGRLWVRAEGQFTMQQDRLNSEGVTFGFFDPNTYALTSFGVGRLRMLTGERSGSLRGTMALHKGVSLGLGLQNTRNQTTWDGELYDSGRTLDLSYHYLDAWGPVASLSLHPGAYASDAAIGHQGSNPDGWLYWPSVHLSAGRLWTFQGEPDGHQKGQRRQAAVGVDLPLTSFLTLEGGLRHRYEWAFLESTFSYSLNPIRDDEEQSLGLRFYLPGDTDAGPWHPHLGAPGAWRLDLRGARELQFRPKGAWLSRTTWTVALQHALPWNVALSLGYQHHVIQQYEPYANWGVHTQPHRHDLNAALSWAFNP